MDCLRLIAAWVASLIYWSIGGVLFLVFSVLLPLLQPRARATALGQRALKMAFRGFVMLLRVFAVVDCEYVGFERLRAQQGRLIVAPNHPALWDAVFVLAEVDRAACVLKASLMRNPILVGGAVSAGFIPNAPAHKMLRQCVQVLRQDERLLFFPEGTRTREEHEPLNPILGGLAIIAKKSEAPVWPIIIETDSPYLRKGWSLWRLPPAKINLRLTVDEPIAYSTYGDARQFLDALRQRYLMALQSPA